MGEKTPPPHFTVCKSLRNSLNTAVGKESQTDAERVVREKEQSRKMSSRLCLFYCLPVFQKTRFFL